VSSLQVTESSVAVRPRLRGVFHQVGFAIACLVAVASLHPLDGRRLVAATAFAAAASGILGASALYHRVTGSHEMRSWMRRIDHAGIYLLIAGTYTTVGLLSLQGTLQRVVLATVWSGAAAALLAKVCRVRAPKWLSAVIATALGCVGVAALTLVALTCQYVAIAFFVVRVG
jgi:hemolysin III